MLKLLTFIVLVAVLVALVVGGVLLQGANPYIAAYAIVIGAALITLVAVVGILALIPFSRLNILRLLRRRKDPLSSKRRAIAKELRPAVRRLPRRSPWGISGQGRTKPVWLVLGPPDGGKTTLIQAAPETRTIATIAGGDLALFESRDAFFIEAKVELAEDHGFVLYRDPLVRALLRRRAAQPIDGIMLVLRGDALDATVDSTKRALVELSAALRVQVPLLLVLTHIDDLRGFGPFAGHLDIGSPLGVLSRTPATSTELPTHITSAFAATNGPYSWVRRRALAMATPAKSTDERERKLDLIRFSTAIDDLVKKGAGWLGRLVDSPVGAAETCHERGLFLVGKRASYANDAESSPLVFARDLVTDILPREGLLASRPRAALRFALFRQLTLTALAIGLASYGIHAALSSAAANRTELSEARRVLSPLLTQGDSEGRDLPPRAQLDEVLAVTERWMDGVAPASPSFGYYRDDDLRPRVDDALRHLACTRVFSPLVRDAKSTLDTAVRTGTIDDPATSALRLYLLFGAVDDETHRSPSPFQDADEVLWLRAYLEEKIPPKLFDYLVTSHRLRAEPTLIAESEMCDASGGRYTHRVDAALATSVRDLLAIAETSALDLETLLTNVRSALPPTVKDITISDVTTSAKLATRGQKIPREYTRQGWDEARRLLVAKISLEAPSWLLKIDATAESRCRDARKRYAAAYLDAWKRFVDDIYIAPPKTLEDAELLLADLTTKEKEPLSALGQALADNTRPAEDRLLPLSCRRAPPDPPTPELDWFDDLAKNFGQLPDPEPLIAWTMRKIHTNEAERDGIEIGDELGRWFAPLNAFFSSGEDSSLSKYHNTLRELRSKTGEYVDDRTRAAELDAQVASSDRSITTLVKNAALGSEWEDPIEELLLAPIKGLRVLGRCADHKTISEDWREVVAEPLSRIVDRYPFSVESARSASLADIEKYFHPESGEIAKFREEQLARFLRREGERLVLADLGKGERNPLTVATLTFLNDAEALGRLLFPGDKAEVNLSVTMSCNPFVDLVELVIGDAKDGTRHTYECDNRPRKDVVWPGENPGAALRFRSSKRHETFTTRSDAGEFGLFKLFERDGGPTRVGDSVALVFHLEAEGQGELPLSVTPTPINPEGGSLLLGPTGSGPFLAPFRARSLRSPPHTILSGSGRGCSEK